MPRGGKRDGAGRPAGSANKDTAASRAALADLVAGHVETAIETLALIAKTGESEAARVSASVAILDRAYGRPGQAVEISDDRVVMPSVVKIVAAEFPISSVADRPDGTIDYRALSSETLDQIVQVSDLIDDARDKCSL